ncbi:MAG: PorV/PorQ family protein [Bacteroidetes Order II. Incertae sedis bacterium]|jgi:hypothetical protein|nr:PorV/PorQ family protein [Bacteroidetes Order II. bacterium]MBT4603161.1 PorV/PorQ family protein [Bacteroidetes Order II. bacterium]MBT5250672.1 PorV/PorQ family protein [Bacteroidetes Order II. bacterium]MBT6202000.1 PorV/PorQ family protein [Bacteroidetes Order II. bacterium]MBT6425765.1 PorV/PorQ family protein [Bacteroidetes Order II. bacterium]
MKDTKRYIALLVLFLVGFQAQAQYAGSFSRIGFGARGISMGNALAADIFQETSPYYNPAHTPLASGQHLEASVAALSFDRSLQFLQVGAPLQQRAGFSIGLIHSSVSNIDGRDNSGFHTSDLSVDEYAGFLAFGLKLSGRISAGINLQMFRTDLYEGLTPARSVGIDLGLIGRITKNWAVGIVLDDLLARYSWDSSDLGSGGRSTTDNFPRRIRLGVTTQQLKSTLILSAEIESRFTSVKSFTRETRLFGDSPAEVVNETNLVLGESRFRFGAEYLMMEQVAFRAGVEQLGSAMLDSVRPSAGFRVDQMVGELRLRLEYAFALEAQAGGKIHLASLKLYL